MPTAGDGNDKTLTPITCEEDFAIGVSVVGTYAMRMLLHRRQAGCEAIAASALTSDPVTVAVARVSWRNREVRHWDVSACARRHG